jgi:hypothetical protein
MSAKPEGFYQASACKSCGRYRRLRFKRHYHQKLEDVRTEWYTVVVRDGVVFAARAHCGACGRALAVKNLETSLRIARQRLQEANAHADEMDKKYRPR